MKRMLYISYVDYNSKEDLGVIKKIEGQKKAFNNAGYLTDHLRINANAVYLNDEYIFRFRNIIDYWIRLPLSLLFYFNRNTTPSYYDFVYVRKTFFNPLYYFFFQQLRFLSNHILMEVPTYPYKMELQGTWRRAILFLDSLNNLLIRKFLYRVVTTQNYSSILGVNTIRIKNGYDFSVLKPLEKQQVENTLRLITVANLSFWHGIDRLLYGLKKYNDQVDNKISIVFHLVGGGRELSPLKQLATKLELNNIIFHGPKYGKALDEVYADADIGVGVLGLYRKGLDFTSSLKNMEYTYYGLPFIIGNQDDDIEVSKFTLRFPNDNSPIDINKVIKWFHSLNIAANEIRGKGKELYGWDKQVGIILNKLI